MSDSREAFEVWSLSNGTHSSALQRNLDGDYESRVIELKFEQWQHQQSRIDELTLELEKAKRALDRAGYTLLEGAQEWKPPIGKSALPMLDKIESLEQENAALRNGFFVVDPTDPTITDNGGDCIVYGATRKSQSKPVTEPPEEWRKGHGKDAVRYCPDCGHVGEVDAKHRDCCPDGSHARMVRPDIAEQANLGFHARLAKPVDEREALQSILDLLTPSIDRQIFKLNGQTLSADNDTEFLSVKKVNKLTSNIGKIARAALGGDANKEQGN